MNALIPLFVLILLAVTFLFFTSNHKTINEIENHQLGNIKYDDSCNKDHKRTIKQKKVARKKKRGY